jgi:hypothetical protein
MFGDLGGLRQELYEKGVTLDASLSQIVQDVASGENGGRGVL